MKTGATYAPAIGPCPLLSIDLDRGLLRRYTRVLFAGVGVKAVKQQHWELTVKAGARWNKLDVFWDLQMLERIRETGSE